MPTEQCVSTQQLLSRNKTRSIDLKPKQFQMAFHFNTAICELERSNSRSSTSTTHSSIIDPGEERSDISLENKSIEAVSKRLCTEYNKVGLDCSTKELNCKGMLLADNNVTNENSMSPDKCKPLRSFLIKDILSHNSSDKEYDADSKCENRGFIRPWDTDSPTSTYINQLNMASSLFHSLQYNAIASFHSGLGLFPNPYQTALGNLRVVPNRRPRSADDDSRSERSESDSPESPSSNSANNANSSPLDALFEMTSKAFERNETNEKSSDPSSEHLNLFNNRATQIKKKRKSRTAFTNHQIFELEKRFLYQKYLSPADRDEIAQSLGLTNAQVITWFQNRRAKLKRDVEELKKDVDAAKINGVPNVLLENIQDLSLLKKTEIVAALHQHAQH